MVIILYNNLFLIFGTQSFTQNWKQHINRILIPPLPIPSTSQSSCLPTPIFSPDLWIQTWNQTCFYSPHWVCIWLSACEIGNYCYDLNDPSGITILRLKAFKVLKIIYIKLVILIKQRDFGKQILSVKLPPKNETFHSLVHSDGIIQEYLALICAKFIYLLWRLY